MGEKTGLKEIAIDSITEPLEQIRTVIVMEGLEELSKSIKEQGVIEPLIVIKKGEKYEVVAGHRRYLAAKMAGLATVPCIIRAIDVKKAELIKLHENFFREDVNPVDEARFYQRLHEIHKLAYSEIAKLSNRSESYVVSRISLLQTDDFVLGALEAKQINFSQALEIARAKDGKIRFELLRVTIESGATVESLRIMRYDYENRTSNLEVNKVISKEGEGPYPEVKHLITCPCCEGSYPVNQIYPISVCKTCYDGFLTGLKDQRK